MCKHLLLLLLLLLPLLLLLTVIELSLGDSIPYDSTDKTDKNKYTLTKQYKKHSTKSKKHSKYNTERVLNESKNN